VTSTYHNILYYNNRHCGVDKLNTIIIFYESRDMNKVNDLSGRREERVQVVRDSLLVFFHRLEPSHVTLRG